MNTERIKEIQQETAYPKSVSVQQALLKVWNECEQEQLRIHAAVGRSEQLVCVGCGRPEYNHTGSGTDICPNNGGRFKEN
jgi:hypothetical protein